MTPLGTIHSLLSAAVYDLFLALAERRGMADHRRALLRGAAGRVLEIGAGTGANLTAYPPQLDALVVTEPDPGMARRLQRNGARHRPDAQVFRAGAAALPFPDAAFDVVVSTMDVLAEAFELQPPARATWRGMPPIVHPLVSGAAVVPCGPPHPLTAVRCPGRPRPAPARTR